MRTDVSGARLYSVGLRTSSQGIFSVNALSAACRPGGSCWPRSRICIACNSNCWSRLTQCHLPDMGALARRPTCTHELQLALDRAILHDLFPVPHSHMSACRCKYLRSLLPDKGSGQLLCSRLRLCLGVRYWAQALSQHRLLPSTSSTVHALNILLSCPSTKKPWASR